MRNQLLDANKPALAQFFSDCDKALIIHGIPKEEIPELPLFSMKFQRGLVIGMRVTRDSAAILEQLRIRQGAQDYAHCPVRKEGDFNFASIEIIALLGDSGAGKSSVINSLLDFPNIAATVRESELFSAERRLFEI